MAAITTAAVGVASSAYTIANAEKQKKDAKKALEGLDVPELDNAFEGISISTEGSDIMREENQRNSAMLIDAARSGGVRSVMGSIPMISALNTNSNREARAYLDDQIIRKEYAMAGDNRSIRGINENRYMGDVQGLNNMIQTQQQNTWMGIRGFGNSLMYAGRNIDWNGDGTTLASESNSNENSFDNQYSM